MTNIGHFDDQPWSPGRAARSESHDFPSNEALSHSARGVRWGRCVRINLPISVGRGLETKMNTLTRIGASTAILLSGIGCGGAGPSDAPGPLTHTRTVGTSTPPVQSLVSMRGFAHASDGSLLPGTHVCFQTAGTNDSGCTTTGNDGSFALSDAPANQSVMITFQKEGFVPTLRAIATETTDIVLPEGENVLLPASDPQIILGVGADPSRGHVEFFVSSPEAQPATAASVTMHAGTAAPRPPIYFGADGAPAPGATSGARGGFVNVRADLYVLRFAGSPSAKCTPMGNYGWPLTVYEDPSSGEAAVLVPVVEGYVTAPVSAWCEKTP